MPVGRKNRGDRGELCCGKRRRAKREKRLRPREKEDSLAGSEEFTWSLLRMRGKRVSMRIVALRCELVRIKSAASGAS